MSIEPILFLQLASTLFLAILFLQSGLDKVFNWQGNYDWIKGHFAKSPLKKMVGLMFPMITIMEVAAGLLCAVGLVLILVNENYDIALLGAELSALSILALFFGQRLAQDYAGAGTLVPYFLVCLSAIYILS